MNRASVILKNAREDKDLDILEVCKKLKISKNYIEAIEKEEVSKFPSEPYCSLIIKDYATFLGLNGPDILSLFRRDFAAPSKSTTTTSSKMSFTPQVIFKWAVVVSMALFIFYIVFEYLKYNRPPPLEVSWPEEMSVVSDSTLEITGSTDPEATIRINNDLIIIDQFGKFHKNINVGKADLKISVESRSHNGKVTLNEKTYHPK